jgi:hypothetical protein
MTRHAFIFLVAVFAAAGPLSADEAGLGEAHLLMCSFGSSAKPLTLNIFHRTGDQNDIQLQDKDALISSEGLNNLIYKGEKGSRKWVFSSNREKPAGTLLIVGSKSPPEFNRDAEIVSATVGVFSAGRPQVGFCFVFDGEKAVRFFDDLKAQTK